MLTDAPVGDDRLIRALGGELAMASGPALGGDGEERDKVLRFF
jgi:hypothetical protein